MKTFPYAGLLADGVNFRSGFVLDSDKKFARLVTEDSKDSGIFSETSLSADEPEKLTAIKIDELIDCNGKQFFYVRHVFFEIKLMKFNF